MELAGIRPVQDCYIYVEQNPSLEYPLSGPYVPALSPCLSDIPGVIGKKAGSEVTKFVEHPTAPALMFKQTLLGPNDTELHKCLELHPHALI